MAYGLHWEWRGFGALDDATTERVSALGARSDVVEVVDQYIWTPHISVNLKVRSWAGGRRLKVKRPVDRIAETGIELWAEHPEDDHELPITSDTATRVLREWGLPIRVSGASVDAAELLECVRRTDPNVRVVSVRKVRSWAATRVGKTMLQVERADILEPQRIGSLGIEDVSGLQRESPPQLFEQAHEAVRALYNHLAPQWEPSNYMRAVASWARGGLIEAS